MIGYLSGKFLSYDDGAIIIEVGGVGYSVLVPASFAQTLSPGQGLELHIHTNLRENALELFGFQSSWEKKVFHALVSVSGVGPKTALTVLGMIEPETCLSAIVREDRATLTSVSGIGKKTAELLIVQLGEKARKLLAERPRREGESGSTAATASRKESRGATAVPAQGASASPVDIADLWNEALAALVNLGYGEGDALAAIRAVSAKAAHGGGDASLEKLIMGSLQQLARGA